MPRRKAGVILESEFVILRALDAQPSHAYGLANALGLGQTTIGAIVRRLERSGFTRSTIGPPGLRDGRYSPARRVYRLTVKGRRALRDAAPRQPVAAGRLR